MAPVIASRMAKNAIPKIMDEHDWQQVFWELKEGYEWPKGNEMECLNLFQKEQSKEEQKKTLENIRFNELGDLPAMEKLATDLKTREVKDWLDNFKEALQIAIRFQDSVSPHRLFSKMVYHLSPLISSVAEKHHQHFENYVAVELWRDYLFGRFTLPLQNLSHKLNDEDESFITSLPAVDSLKPSFPQQKRTITGVAPKMGWKRFETLNSVRNNPIDYLQALLESALDFHKCYKFLEHVGNLDQQKKVLRVLIKDVPSAEKWFQNLEAKRFKLSTFANRNSHLETSTETFNRSKQKLETLKQQLIEEKNIKDDLGDVNVTLDLLDKPIIEWLTNDVAHYILIFEPQFADNWFTFPPIKSDSREFQTSLGIMQDRSCAIFELLRNEEPATAFGECDNKTEEEHKKAGLTNNICPQILVTDLNSKSDDELIRVYVSSLKPTLMDLWKANHSLGEQTQQDHYQNDEIAFYKDYIRLWHDHPYMREQRIVEFVSNARKRILQASTDNSRLPLNMIIGTLQLSSEDELLSGQEKSLAHLRLYGDRESAKNALLHSLVFEPLVLENRSYNSEKPHEASNKVITLQIQGQQIAINKTELKFKKPEDKEVLMFLAQNSQKVCLPSNICKACNLKSQSGLNDEKTLQERVAPTISRIRKKIKEVLKDSIHSEDIINHEQGGYSLKISVRFIGEPPTV